MEDENINENKDKTEFEIKLVEFYNFRKQIKKPIIEASKQQFLNVLTKLSKGNETTAIEILNQSIANGWQGIFELKTQNTNGKSTTTFETKQQGIDRRNAEYEQKLADRLKQTFGQ